VACQWVRQWGGRCRPSPVSHGLRRRRHS
jgi:hypothetical protein